MKIWCLFSVENNYDQPPNNLEAWWSTKPGMVNIGQVLGVKWPSENDETTLQIVRLWEGQSVRINNADYRLEEIKEGQV